VCFTVSEAERIAIDALAASIGRTRSSILTRIVNAFISDVAETGQFTQLSKLLADCSTGSSSKQTPPNRK
jgi:predicted DNA-binding protein